MDRPRRVASRDISPDPWISDVQPAGPWTVSVLWCLFSSPSREMADVVRDCGDKRQIKKQKLPPHPQAPGGDTAEGSLL